ncbi:3'(2'),5'-bisphosphate nucleotidase CysQ [Mesorhizobium sp. YC-39]|uniref:3'(2'),5'-bisphosphate nucleotidase CysQ n=1 Tax=unclassified Mesorhizobium TaxID=325217 RepID=UPI0021E83D14|nr:MULTISPECIES: 3'(2'),5'-bisphosphate nucleotidase CysQ [unclassified Mesorhizobium]MCV3210517.1 3'(2'),5'-bisphosphate nucleotidase CysQ [Mesorhizobium sp. YC-2]MCV3232585.1 3'(2'),5'-bisphosphate nucleotidase CysQ [Mesorhizobium sp. YC-39]
MLDHFEHLALAAGREVMRVFNAGCAVDRKSDSSPVTEADRESEKIILAGLRAAFPGIPCVAEEEASAGIMPPDLGDAFFLIDPLDGTKEFVNRRTDFTVNIALVRHGVPEIGVVFAPCTGRFFSGRPGRAETIEVNDDYQITGRQPISARKGLSPLTIVASRSHNTPETDAFIRDLGAAEIVSVGSSLKFCLVAAAEADVYPRFGRTMEWDTAAGDAVLRAAGGMTRTLDGKPLTYGKREQADDEDFANPHFIASGKAGELEPA